MRRRPPRSTLTDPLFPDTPHFRSKKLVYLAQTEDAALDAGAAAAAARLGLAYERHFTGYGGLGDFIAGHAGKAAAWPRRSEEHTSELQSLMRISYAVFCLKKKKIQN